jgi:methionine sulfoxide reductase catalytic subunit
MLIRKPSALDGSSIPSSEITPKDRFLNRRRFLKGVATGAATLAASRLADLVNPAQQVKAARVLATRESSLTTTGEELTSFKDITSYNNFYEFGTDKYQPATNAAVLPIHPWTIQVSGLVHKPRTFDLETLLKLCPLENRVYRHRCIEGWSMVVPWVGYSLSELIKQCEPLSTAKYVQFLSYYDKNVAKWTSLSTIPWPYSEGLRIDEAMNPLTLLTVGLYGDVLPKQNGAPVRIIIPWKYGIKSPKSVVAIRFLDKQPDTTWNKINPEIYGFYSNVNPGLQHPRWNQKTERRIGQPFWAQRRSSMLFNGYGDFVASMYNGMDLNRNF